MCFSHSRAISVFKTQEKHMESWREVCLKDIKINSYKTGIFLGCPFTLSTPTNTWLRWSEACWFLFPVARGVTDQARATFPAVSGILTRSFMVTLAEGVFWHKFSGWAHGGRQDGICPHAPPPTLCAVLQESIILSYFQQKHWRVRANHYSQESHHVFTEIDGSGRFAFSGDRFLVHSAIIALQTTHVIYNIN